MVAKIKCAGCVKATLKSAEAAIASLPAAVPVLKEYVPLVVGIAVTIEVAQEVAGLVIVHGAVVGGVLDAEIAGVKVSGALP